jgi:drug/metabolite transporter (DMT)-like permease
MSENTTAGARRPSRDPSAGTPGRPSNALAVLALVLVAVVWGVTFSLVKVTLATTAPADLVAWRFSVAALVLWLARPRQLRGVTRRVVLHGTALGGLLGAGFLLHTWGMRSTPVVVSAFVTGTVVIFAPLAAWLWGGHRVGRRTVTAVVLAAAGLALITVRGAALGHGALLIAAAAALWGVHLVALERWCRPGEVYQLALIQMLVVAGLAAVVQLSLAGRLAVPRDPTAVGALLAMGALATGGAFLALTWAQTRADATTAAVVLTLEPVFGAVTAVVLGEVLTWPVTLGALAVVGAALIVAAPHKPARGPLAHRRRRLLQRRRGDLEALDPAQGHVLVLDVHRHLGVHVVKGLEEVAPEGGVVTPTQGHEVPGRVLGPLVDVLVTAESDPGLVLAQPAEPVVEHAVDGGVLVDPDVLGGRVEDQRTEVADGGHRVHPLPEEVARVHLRSDVGRARPLDQLHQRGR